MQAAHEFIYDLAEKISMPAIYLEISRLMKKPNAEVGDFEKLVEADSMLTLRIIRIANSQFFGFKRKANNLYEAISLIGVIQVHDMLLSSLCLRAFYNIPEQVLNFNDFWRHGIQCGIAARTLAKFCGLPAGNRFFTLGLLLEIGHALMYIKAPDLSSKTLLVSQQYNRPLVTVEREYFGFDYCQLGAVLMRHWHLPEIYSQIIEHHLCPERTEPHYRMQTDLVNLAHRLLEEKGYLYNQLTQLLTYHQQLVPTPIPENIEQLVFNTIVEHGDEVLAMLTPYNCTQGEPSIPS